MQFRHQASQASLTCHSIRVYFLKCKVMNCHHVLNSVMSLWRSYRSFAPSCLKKGSVKNPAWNALLVKQHSFSVRLIYCNEQNNSSYTFDNQSHVLKHYYKSQHLILPLQAEPVKKGMPVQKSKTLEFISLPVPGHARSKTMCLEELCHMLFYGYLVQK